MSRRNHICEPQRKLDLEKSEIHESVYRIRLASTITSIHTALTLASSAEALYQTEFTAHAESLYANAETVYLRAVAQVKDLDLDKRTRSKLNERLSRIRAILDGLPRAENDGDSAARSG